ncbi:hydroxyacylglutathione hydrolase [Haliea sp. E17]|uniref:hydroxyacylglutathione hydrolase n=1 Tax=Haliea sp. E17 TaxID=3401576 RepID=UPI003AADF615
MLQIRPIPAFDDNYIWLITREGHTGACVVDPGDAAPVEAVLQREGLQLDTVFITHHHFDHVGGLARLIERYAPLVYGPDNPAIAGIGQALHAGDAITLFGAEFRILEVPGHTLDHIAYFHPGNAPVLFCGDTLFAGGCGRLFEGTPATMYASLLSLAKLPPQTRVYCAHEYTLANLRFARAVEPGNSALADRERRARQLRENAEPTVPSTIAEELATNPFLRCEAASVIDSLRTAARLQGTRAEEVFASVRAWKDSF